LVAAEGKMPQNTPRCNGASIVIRRTASQQRRQQRL